MFGKEKKGMSENAKKAKLTALKEAHSMAKKMMEDDLKGLKKVSVVSDSPEGLEKGLDKAKEIVEGEEEELEDCESCEGEGCEHCAESEDEESEDEEDSEEESEDEEDSEEESEDLDIDELEAKIAELMAKKEKLKK